MNKQESDILNALLLEPFINQRILAEVSGHSLGVVNRCCNYWNYLQVQVNDVKESEVGRMEKKTCILIMPALFSGGAEKQYRYIMNRKLEKEEHSGFNVLIPARITRIKNQMVAVRALQYLNDIPIKIYLAGGIEDQGYFDELRTESEKLQILDKIEFCGYVKNMPQLYAMTDLVVLPSYEEGTPNVLLEAYLYGIPAVASNIPSDADSAQLKSFLTIYG